MKKNVALVLSSGGSRGLAQIGIINELEKQGFNISSVSGSSIGSVIGGLHAMGKLDEYTDWVKALNRKDVWGLMDFTITTHGLLRGEKVFDRMKTFIPDMNIEEMSIPYTAVAVDILNGKEIVFSSGSFYDAIRASIAIPTIITPVRYKDTILVDGGILHPIPIEHVTRRPDDILVIVNLYGERKDEIEKTSSVEKTQNHYNLSGLLSTLSSLISTGDKHSLGYLSLLNSTISLMIQKIAQQNIEKFKPEMVISIPCDSANTFDFHRANDLIKMGEIAAKNSISKYLMNHN